jgi:hypothetical protein
MMPSNASGNGVEKPLSSMETIPAELHRAVMELPEDDRRDRAKVNAAYRDGSAISRPS